MSHGGTVYEDLPHPPATYIGAQYQYRTADGSYNNICVPDMGKASTPYARSVQQVNSTSLDTLPDPGLVFDTLLKRRRVRYFHHRVLMRAAAH
jgi:linoleate 10R-lipoxygenase